MSYIYIKISRNTVYVKNFPFELTDEELTNMFSNVNFIYNR